MRGSIQRTIAMVLAGAAMVWARPVSAAEPLPGDGVYLDDTTQQSTPAASGFDGDLTGDWGGARQKLQDAGITVGAALTLERCV